MHRSPHKLLTGLFALLLLVVASQALADGPRGHGSRHHGSGHHGSRSHYTGYSFSHHGSYSNYSYNNYWYRPYGPRYVVVAPPFGFGVSVLPPYYSTLWYGGSPYYYADSTYYTYRPERREYVVTGKPSGEPETRVETGGSEEIFVYPKNGQTEEQQSTDRYECHRWAVDKTGFDPTRPSGNVGGTEITTKRVDYRRAESACLDARGYTVR